MGPDPGHPDPNCLTAKIFLKVILFKNNDKKNYLPCKKLKKVQNLKM